MRRGVNFELYEFTCGPGTVFDERIQVCNHVWSAPPCRNAPGNLPIVHPITTTPVPFLPPVDIENPDFGNPADGGFGNPGDSASGIPVLPPGDSGNPVLPPDNGIYNPVSQKPGENPPSTGSGDRFPSGSEDYEYKDDEFYDDIIGETGYFEYDPDYYDSETNSSYEVLPGSLYRCPEPGFFPFETNCHEFYVCQETLPGKLIADQLYRCPDRYLFDEAERICLKEHLATCTKSGQAVTGITGYGVPQRMVLVVLEAFVDDFFKTPLTYNETKRKFG